MVIFVKATETSVETGLPVRAKKTGEGKDLHNRKEKILKDTNLARHAR